MLFLFVLFCFSLQKCSNTVFAKVWSFVFFFLLIVGNVEEEEKLRSHAIPMLLSEDPKKKFL